MALNIGVLRSQIGSWTADETKEVATMLLCELSDADITETVVQVVGADEALVDELSTALSKL